jgi:hypothetical protein
VSSPGSTCWLDRSTGLAPPDHTTSVDQRSPVVRARQGADESIAVDINTDVAGPDAIAIRLCFGNVGEGVADLVTSSDRPRGSAPRAINGDSPTGHPTYRLTADTCCKAHTGAATSVNPM